MFDMSTVQPQEVQTSNPLQEAVPLSTSQNTGERHNGL